MEKEKTIELHKIAVEGISNYLVSQGFIVNSSHLDFDQLGEDYIDRGSWTNHYKNIYFMAKRSKDYSDFYGQFIDAWAIKDLDELYKNALKYEESVFIEKCLKRDMYFRNVGRGDIYVAHSSTRDLTMRVVGGMTLSDKKFKMFKGDYVVFYDFDHPEKSKIARRKNVDSYFKAIRRNRQIPEDKTIIQSFKNYKNYCEAQDFSIFWTQMTLLNAENNPDVKTELIRAYFAKQLPQGVKN